METTEVEKSTSSEDTSQLNRNRSFKSKQLVRSQAIRETHSPPRALSPAQRPTPTVTISATTVGLSTPSVNDNTSDVDNTATNGGDGISDVETSPNVANSSPNALNSTPNAENVNDERTVSASEESSHVSVRCSDVVNSSDVKHSDSDDFKKKLPVEIQITPGVWEQSQHERQRARRWHSDAPRDLLSNNPRVSCVCGTCTACVHCRGRRRRHYCAMKQDSGISCSDDCPDCSDNDTGSNNDTIRKSSSLDIDDQPYYCRCPERKERPKNISLTRNDSDDRYEPSGPELVAFIKETLNKNVRDRMALLKIERELHALVNDTGRCIVRFPVMTSYGRMLVHRCAALFQLSHHLDQTNKTSVLVSKSGTSGGRIPCTSFKEWCTATFPAASPQRHATDATHAKSILKRDTHSLDEPGSGALANNRSKSLEQREREYERVRRRIFSSQDEAQWPWIATGPIKLLTPEGGRNKLLKVQSLEGGGPPPGCAGGGRGAVSKSHSFGGYAAAEPRQLSRQGDLASSSWRLSPSSSGYKTLSLRSTDSITPSPTGGASPEPSVNVSGAGASVPGIGECGPGTGACGPGTRACVPGAGAEGAVVWAVTDMCAVPPGAVVIHPQTGRPLTNPDGTVYQFDPDNPPVLYDPPIVHTEQLKLDPTNEKRRGRLEKQHSFIDNDCECQPPSEECRSKCCCECRRHDGCSNNNNADKETNPKPASPFETNIQDHSQETTTDHQEYEETNNQTEHYELTANQHTVYEPTANQQPSYEQTANQQPAYEPTANQQPAYEQTANQQIAYEQTANHKPYDNHRTYEPANPNVNNNNRPVKLTNEGQELQYQQYAQGYRTDDQVRQYPHELHGQVMPPLTLPVPDPNTRPMALSNMTSMMYPAPMPQPYPYQCRLEPPLQMYPQVLPTEEQKLAPSPHNDTAFRIEPSYPYVPLECGACADSAGHQPHRSYSVGYPAVEVPPGAAAPVLSVPPGAAAPVLSVPHYALSNVMVPHSHIQPYPQYQEQVPWAAAAHKLFPLVQYPHHSYPHYNLLYPQVIPQPYPICQPVYPVIDKTDQRRNSINSNRPSKHNSARNTPLQEEKQSYEDKSVASRQNSDIAAKIQQIKNQMAQLNTKDYRFDKEKRRDEWRRRNSGNGLLGNCPVNSFNGRVVGRGTNDEGHLSSAARAIVNSIRNMQAKNTYHDNRRDYQRYDHKQDRPEFRRRYEREDNKPTDKDTARPTAGHASGERYDVRNRGLNVPVYRQPYLFRQMSPGTWCRRSPGPVHPVLNPRRPHPDTRNPRR